MTFQFAAEGVQRVSDPDTVCSPPTEAQVGGASSRLHVDRKPEILTECFSKALLLKEALPKERLAVCRRHGSGKWTACWRASFSLQRQCAHSCQRDTSGVTPSTPARAALCTARLADASGAKCAWVGSDHCAFVTQLQCSSSFQQRLCLHDAAAAARWLPAVSQLARCVCPRWLRRPHSSDMHAVMRAYVQS